MKLEGKLSSRLSLYLTTYDPSLTTSSFLYKQNCWITRNKKLPERNNKREEEESTHAIESIDENLLRITIDNQDFFHSHSLEFFIFFLLLLSFSVTPTSCFIFNFVLFLLFNIFLSLFFFIIFGIIRKYKRNFYYSIWCLQAWSRNFELHLIHCIFQDHIYLDCLIIPLLLFPKYQAIKSFHLLWRL